MFYLCRINCLWVLIVFIACANNVSTSADLPRGHHQPHQLSPVWPPPQEISSSHGRGITLNRDVTIVTGSASDAATIDAVKAIVSSVGGRVSLSSRPRRYGAQILIGTGKENTAAADAATALTGKSADGLTTEGYVLASGEYGRRRQPTIVLNGVDTRGTFYAAQTLRQLLAANTCEVPVVTVRDWPLMPVRGSIEGFYGIPWSHQARLDQFAFYGKHKMNTYIYTPKGDSYLRAKWRDLYGDSELLQLKELVDTANSNQVDFTFALSPGLDICYSSDADFNTTVTKFDQVRELGVSSFYIALDDIPLKFHCDSDKNKWKDTGNYHWLADAQAYYLNRVQKEYVEAKGLKDLEIVPTNYAGSAPDPYKGELGTQLDKNIRVQWTGEGVFSPNVTISSVVRASSTYVTDKLFFWDNFPVNDGMPGRLFLNPLIDRDPQLYKYLLGFTSNPMVQSYASMIALANYGDYTWNGPAYNANTSMASILRELAGDDRGVHEAVVAFADINQNWPYRNPEINAPQLSKDIAAYWASRNASYSFANNHALRSRLELLSALPETLQRMAAKDFAADVQPWSVLAVQWARACQHLVAMLEALEHGSKGKATHEFDAAQKWVEKTKAKTVSSLSDDGEIVPNSILPTTGDGVFDMFLAKATEIYKNQA